MAGPQSSQDPRGGRIKDARGRSVRLVDPVRLHLLNQRSIIPVETLRTMTDELLPGAKRQRMLQLLSLALGFLVVVGGTIIYFRYFSSWKGFDPVNVTIYTVQFVIIVSGPVLAFRMARAKYAGRIVSVMLAHRHCPHCGYDIRGLPPSADDGSTVCPECGSAWCVPSQAPPERLRVEY